MTKPSISPFQVLTKYEKIQRLELVVWLFLIVMQPKDIVKEHPTWRISAARAGPIGSFGEQNVETVLKNPCLKRLHPPKKKP